MDRLRSPGGCPWDAEQTHESLLKYQLEESYEYIEAVEKGDRADMREELGDLLLQVYFHSRIAQEDSNEPFNIDDVAKGVADKLISRHPHVFGDTKVSSSQEVHANWERIKNEEKGRTEFDEGVPLNQPALSLAAKLILRAEKNGLKSPEPLAPTKNSLEDESSLGDALLALISWAVKADLDPEAALRKAALRYRDSIKEAR
ncbi:MAG: MazG family protein [Actinobacteria bacterium]|nr:MazG family protein [Actinomycetota bacterium]NDE83283.1 MazG family protein [Actinomycetota bacterium]